MWTGELACPGVRVNVTADGTFRAVWAPPPPAGTVPPSPPMAVVPVAVEEDMNMVDLVILRVVTLVSWSHLSLLIRLT